MNNPNIPTVPVEVVLPMTPQQLRKERHKQDMEEARLFEQMGQKVIKVKLDTLKKVGENLQQAGVRVIGHGRIVVAAENADRAFVACANQIDNLTRLAPVDARETIAELLRLSLAFNAQLLAAGEAHLNADRQPELGPKGSKVKKAFPPASAVIVVQPCKQPEAPALPAAAP